MHNAIIKAIESAWENHQEPHIQFVVGSDGAYDDRIVFPIGCEQTANGVSRMTINIGLNACKMFTYNQESNDFVYDIAIKGRQFFGNIPLDSIMIIYDSASNDLIWMPSDLYEPVESVEEVQQVPVKSTPILHLLCNDSEPKQFSPTFKAWTPKLVV